MGRAEQQKHRQQWQKRVAEYKASGQSVKQWCAAKGVKPDRMWYWLRHAGVESQPQEQPTRWLQAVVDANAAAAPTEDCGLLIRVGKASVEVKQGFDPELFRAVVRALSAIC